MGRALTITSAVIIIAVGARASSKERVTEAIVLNIIDITNVTISETKRKKKNGPGSLLRFAMK
tara:strand:+ start:151 stop:339 length:189 start_codon:yes stop_codon:yes gene_type:complete